MYAARSGTLRDVLCETPRAQDKLNAVFRRVSAGLIMHFALMLAKLQHIAQNAHMPSVQAQEGVNAALHRVGVRVIAVVDQRDKARVAHRGAAADRLIRRDPCRDLVIGQSQQESNRSALQRRINHVLPERGNDRVNAPLAVHDVALGVRRGDTADILRANVAVLAEAEGCFLLATVQRAQLLVVAVHDDRCVVRHIIEHLALGAHHAVQIMQELQMRVADHGIHRHRRPRHRRKPAHLAEAGYPHLHNGDVVFRCDARERHRYADLVIEVFVRFQHRPALRQHR